MGNVKGISSQVSTRQFLGFLSQRNKFFTYSTTKHQEKKEIMLTQNTDKLCRGGHARGSACISCAPQGQMQDLENLLKAPVEKTPSGMGWGQNLVPLKDKDKRMGKKVKRMGEKNTFIFLLHIFLVILPIFFYPVMVLYSLDSKHCEELF